MHGKGVDYFEHGNYQVWWGFKTVYQHCSLLGSSEERSKWPRPIIIESIRQDLGTDIKYWDNETVEFDTWELDVGAYGPDNGERQYYS